jgi:hypothetical protein
MRKDFIEEANPNEGATYEFPQNVLHDLKLSDVKYRNEKESKNRRTVWCKKIHVHHSELICK